MCLDPDHMGFTCLERSRRVSEPPRRRRHPLLECWRAAIHAQASMSRLWKFSRNSQVESYNKPVVPRQACTSMSHHSGKQGNERMVLRLKHSRCPAHLTSIAETKFVEHQPRGAVGGRLRCHRSAPRPKFRSTQCFQPLPVNSLLEGITTQERALVLLRRLV